MPHLFPRGPASGADPAEAQRPAARQLLEHGQDGGRRRPPHTWGAKSSASLARMLFFFCYFWEGASRQVQTFLTEIQTQFGKEKNEVWGEKRMDGKTTNRKNQSHF